MTCATPAYISHQFIVNKSKIIVMLIFLSLQLQVRVLGFVVCITSAALYQFFS